MGLLKHLFILAFAFFLSACQASYLLKSSYEQIQIWNAEEPIEKSLERQDLTSDQKHKLRLALEVKKFCEEDLGLKKSKNYTRYVQLDRPYVKYVLSAAPPWEFKNYEWSYPIVGKMPYKGFSYEIDAKTEEEKLKQQGLETYFRGVSAYSTLGWFNDPLLSSMLNSSDYELVDTIIHETVHATLYIKNSADFNERLAVFLGEKGAELFYLKKEGTTSKTLQQMNEAKSDQDIFGKFISKEVQLASNWFLQNGSKKNKEEKENMFKEILLRFETEALPKMKTKNFAKFHKKELNNARLLIYKTYLQDLSDFDKLWTKTNSDFKKFMTAVKEFEKSPDPDKTLKATLQ